MEKNMTHEDKAWIDYKQSFADLYDNSNYSSPLQTAVMHASHRLLERPYSKKTHFSRVLEIGAGTGEHVGFVRHDFDEYVLTDTNQKALDIAIKKTNNKFKYEIQESNSLNYLDNTFDRVVAIHVLEHILQPHLALIEWTRVLKHGGNLSILIPTDPGIAWRLGRHLGPRRQAISKGIAYDYVMAREHVNSCNNLIAILRHHFHERTESWWPFSLPSVDINLFFSFNTIINKQSNIL